MDISPASGYQYVWHHNSHSLLILLCGLVWFYAYKCHICLPISAAHGIWEWLMILTLFAQLTYVNVLYWIVVLYYHGFLVNAGIGLIIVIQIFYKSTLSVLYNKDVYPTSSIVWSTTFPFNILKSHKTLSYSSDSLCFFTLLILKFIYIYVHFYVFIYYYYHHAVSALNISFY